MMDIQSILQEIKSNYIANKWGYILETKYPETYTLLKEKYGSEFSKNEIFHCELNNIDISKLTCPLGNKRIFRTVSSGYTNFCGKDLSCPCYITHIKKINDNRTIEEWNEISGKIKNVMFEKYGVESASQFPLFKEKAKKTNINKYGVVNPAQNRIIRDKINTTNIERYGYMNPQNNKNIRQKSITGYYKTIFNRNLEKLPTLEPLFTVEEYSGYYVDYSWRCKTCLYEFIDHFTAYTPPKCPKCFPSNRSLFEDKICDIISINHHIQPNTKTIIPPKEIDIYIPEKQIAIECNGLYWHSIARGKDKSYHISKTIECKKIGVELIQIWDFEWYQHSNGVMKYLNSILDPICIDQMDINFIDNELATMFLENNAIGYQNNIGISIGGYINNNLIAVMTFVQECNAIHITNICLDKDSTFNKFIDVVINSINPNKIISVIDRRLPIPAIKDKFILLDTIDPELVLDVAWDCGKEIWIWKNE